MISPIRFFYSLVCNHEYEEIERAPRLIKTPFGPAQKVLYECSGCGKSLIDVLCICDECVDARGDHEKITR